MFKFLATVMVSFTLALTACSSSNYNSDEVPDISPENLYNVAKTSMATGDFATARRYLEAIDSRYPFGALTSQVQLDLIYVYYKERESELAMAQINRFIRLSPTHPNVDYVYYMKGLTEIQQRSDMIQDYLGLDRSEKDPTYYEAAFSTFRDLIRSYPNSIYAADARQRMIFIKEELAKREMAIAEYYFEREAYVSSIRHCQNILYTFRSTQQLRPALELMARGYERLNLVDPANNTRRVLASTFGESYTPLVSNNASTPIDPATGAVATTAVATPAEEKSWFDSIGDWIWGDDEEEVAAAPAAPAARSAYPSGAASGPDSMRTQGAAAHAVATASAAEQYPTATTSTTGASSAAAVPEEKSWIDSVGDFFFGEEEGATVAPASTGASGPESARNRAAAQAAMDSAAAASAASASGDAASTSGASGEATQGSWVDGMTGWMSDVEAPATNASGPESARNRAAAEAVLDSDATVEGEGAADAAASSAEGNGPWQGWMNDHETTGAASGPESARNEAAARAAVGQPRGATTTTEPSNNSGAQYIHFNN